MTTEVDDALAEREYLEELLEQYVGARNARQAYDSQVSELGTHREVRTPSAAGRSTPPA